MKHILHTLIALAVLSVSAGPLRAEEKKDAPAAQSEKKGGPPVVVFETTLGSFEVELNEASAPISAKNFLGYVKEGFYDGTIFHRVIADFMVQGGGFTKDMQQKPTKGPIKNEAGNGLKNTRGTVAMARTNVVDSATAQFFINVVDNAFLDHRDESPQGFGYAVFGRVTKGMDVVDKIRKVKTGVASGMRDVPVDPVVIRSAKLKGGEGEEKPKAAKP
ncbi:MAG: peptidyl-prolyl cis-trans isomerase [Nitrospirae bacterium]|nr:peptidyl-prolyl cis-trans isomerase [Nitrospirota bacterium]